MTIIWVTGTNGKTTTSNIIGQWLQSAGKKVFMFTTVNIMIDGEMMTNHSKMTSPDAFELQKWFKIAKSKGCDTAVIETASHGIKMHRIWGLAYDMCVLTNITQDHLDLHRTMDDYIATKHEIFRKLMYYPRKEGVKKVGVVNVDSQHNEAFLDDSLYDVLYTYGIGYDANLRARDIDISPYGMQFKITIPGQDLVITTSLRWKFNILNILAAVCIFNALWIEHAIIEKAISEVKWIPWRMEELTTRDGFRIIIDYAHTPDALEKVLSTLNEIKWNGRLITVFGATGDRDKGKRPIMWEVVSRLSDIVIVTQDDDYTENTQEIIKDILPGIERKQWDDFWIISERKEALRTALIMAKKDDIVLLAGKWDEHALITNEGPQKWHERSVAEEILAEIDDNQVIQ